MTSHSNVPRVRSRLSWLGKKVSVPTILEPMMSIESTKSMNLDRLIHAYEVAEKLHRGVVRKSGEPYITHPVAVATILAELGLDEDTLVAALCMILWRTRLILLKSLVANLALLWLY